MASLITTIPGVMFPYELNQLVISADEEVAVKMEYAGRSVLDTVLSPYNGQIAIHNMATHIIDYMGNEMGALTISLDGKVAASTQILPNTLGVAETAANCYHDIFLTRASCKYTHPEAKELLHFVQNGETYGIVKAVVRVDGEVLVSEQELPVTLVGDIVTLDVSPLALFSLEGYELMEYTIWVGSRMMKYRMIPDGMADTLHEFGFINSFMQEEYITLMGDAERDVKVERRSSYVHGQLRNYHVEAFPHWTINTHVTDGMAGMFDDFVAAKDIWRKEDGCVLAITESANKTTSRTSAMNMGSITLREAGRIYLHQPVRQVRTFDQTFDDTFQ